MRFRFLSAFGGRNMAITFVQSKTGFTNSATTVDVIFDTTPTAGNIVVAAACTSGSMPHITGTAIDFWSVVRSANLATSASLSVGWVQASPAATITANINSAAPISMVIAEYTGISLSLDQAIGAIGSGTTPSSGASDTTTAVNELWLGAIGARNTGPGTLFSAPLNSFAIVDQTNTTSGGANADRAIVLLSRIVSATGTVTAACTSSGTNWAAIGISLK